MARVDVSPDAGATWMQAHLDAPDGPWTWQHWCLDADLPLGAVQILARAWDTTGALQPEHAADLWNPKGYVNNSCHAGSPRQMGGRRRAGWRWPGPPPRHTEQTLGSLSEHRAGRSRHRPREQRAAGPPPSPRNPNRLTRIAK